MDNFRLKRNAAIKDLQTYLSHSVEMLVENTEQIEIDFVDRGVDNYSSFIISVAKKDIGRVIGTNGRTLAALRTILVCASTKLRMRTQLEISDEETTARKSA